MAFTQFSYDMEIIGKLSDTPNVDDGLAAAQLKDKFDEGGKAIKDYINNVLLQEAAEKTGVTGMVKAVGGKLVAAEPDVDYQTPIGSGDITTAMFAPGATAPKATQLETSRNITVKDSSGTYSGTAAGFSGTADITLKMPATGRFDKLILGSGAIGTSLPSNPVEGQVFLLIEG